MSANVIGCRVRSNVTHQLHLFVVGSYSDIVGTTKVNVKCVSVAGILLCLLVMKLCSHNWNNTAYKYFTDINRVSLGAYNCILVLPPVFTMPKMFH